MVPHSTVTAAHCTPDQGWLASRVNCYMRKRDFVKRDGERTSRSRGRERNPERKERKRERAEERGKVGAEEMRD